MGVRDGGEEGKHIYTVDYLFGISAPETFG